MNGGNRTGDGIQVSSGDSVIEDYDKSNLGFLETG
jgi:hypothetical protein